MPQYIPSRTYPHMPGKPRSWPRRRLERAKLDGATVEPGRVITKAERNVRTDSIVCTLDGQGDDVALADDNDYSFRALAAKVKDAMRRRCMQLGLNLDRNATYRPLSGLTMHSPAAIERGAAGHRQPLRSFILFLIAFLLVFGSLYTLTQYLLVTTRASAACSTSTIYFPVTHTVFATTCSLPAFSQAVPAYDNTSTVTVYASATLTSYATISPLSSSSSPLDTPSSSAFLFTVNSAGVTSWLNGMSPPAGVSLTTGTTTITVTPGTGVSTITMPAVATPTEIVQSTDTLTPLITGLTDTSTLYSLLNNETYTSTSTSTHFITESVVRVTPHSNMTVSQSALASKGSGGWNSTVGSGMTRADFTTVLYTSTLSTGPVSYSCGLTITSTHHDHRRAVPNVDSSAGLRIQHRCDDYFRIAIHHDRECNHLVEHVRHDFKPQRPWIQSHRSDHKFDFRRSVPIHGSRAFFTSSNFQWDRHFWLWSFWHGKFDFGAWVFGCSASTHFFAGIDLRHSRAPRFGSFGCVKRRFRSRP